jgi:hypothetical protein
MAINYFVHCARLIGSTCTPRFCVRTDSQCRNNRIEFIHVVVGVDESVNAISCGRSVHAAGDLANSNAFQQKNDRLNAILNKGSTEGAWGDRRTDCGKRVNSQPSILQQGDLTNWLLVVELHAT